MCLIELRIKMKKLGLLIIARSSSKRFKNKIEYKIENYSLLEILILRLLKSGFNKKKNCFMYIN